MRHIITVRCRAASVALLGLLLAGLTAAAQSPADDWLERLRAERFRMAEATLVQAGAKTPPATPVAADHTAPTPESPLAWEQRLGPGLRLRLRQALEAEGVPGELLAVGWVESRFDPEALSARGARGAWQLMPATARRFGLEVSRQRDDRTDLHRSTRAAARYLAELRERFGDWLLVLAAYNAGEQRVDDALARAGSHSFWQARPWLPAETREYVPAVLAAMGNAPAAPGTSDRGGGLGGRIVFAQPEAHSPEAEHNSTED